MDLLTLQAVIRADGEVQVLDRHAISSDVLGLLRGGSDLDAFGSVVQLASQAEKLNQGATGGSQCIACGNRVLGFDVDGQLVKVGALLNTSCLDLVGDLENRGCLLYTSDAADE